jgi:hypothetical protein
MPDYQPIDYRLRCHTKRTDLPADVLRDIGEAYAEIERLRKELDTRIAMCDMRSEKIIELTNERDEARRDVCNLRRAPASCDEGIAVAMREYAKIVGWDCFNTPEAKVDRTLNGVIVDGGKAVPPKYEDLGDE